MDENTLMIQIIYQDVDLPSPVSKLKEVIKNSFKELIINDKGVIKSAKMGAIGTRG